MLYLACLTPNRMIHYMDRKPILSGLPGADWIRSLHEESLERMFDLLLKGECSDVIGKDPIAQIRAKRRRSFLRKKTDRKHR